jgi:hypothetical protein
MNGASNRETCARAKARGEMLRAAAALALAWACGACAAASRKPDAARPAAAEPTNVTLEADDDRRERALAAWAALAHEAGLAVPPPAPELRPVTATLGAMPQAAVGRLKLPLVEIRGAGPGARPTKENEDEALHESLRRFITSARDLLGVSLDQLSLVGVRDEGTARVAAYEQRPFRRPLRNGYGRVEVRFAPDRSVLGLSSTAIPEADRLARALGQLRQREMTADQAAARIKGRAFTYTDAAGATRTRTVAANDAASVRDLVIYPVPRPGDPNALDLHAAWEVAVGGAGGVLAYVDAVTGEIIAAAPDTTTQTAAGQ